MLCESTDDKKRNNLNPIHRFWCYWFNVSGKATIITKNIYKYTVLITVFCTHVSNSINERFTSYVNGLKRRP